VGEGFKSGREGACCSRHGDQVRLGVDEVPVEKVTTKMVLRNGRGKFLGEKRPAAG